MNQKKLDIYIDLKLLWKRKHKDELEEEEASSGILRKKEEAIFDIMRDKSEAYYSCWGHTPILVYIPSILVLMSRPWTKAAPSVGFVRPIIYQKIIHFRCCRKQKS